MGYSFWEDWRHDYSFWEDCFFRETMILYTGAIVYKVNQFVDSVAAELVWALHPPCVRFFSCKNEYRTDWRYWYWRPDYEDLLDIISCLTFITLCLCLWETIHRILTRKLIHLPTYFTKPSSRQNNRPQRHYCSVVVTYCFIQHFALQ